MRTGAGRAVGALAMSVALAFTTVAPTARAQTAPVGRVSGGTRIETAVAVSASFWPTSQTAVVATARAFPDALVAGPLAARLDAPILLTEPAELPAAVADELVRLDVSEVVVLGGQGAVAPNVVAAIEALPTRPEAVRIAGDSRHGTAAAVALQAAPDGAGDVLVASGAGFSDALTAASLVAAAPAALPILLTNRDALPEVSATALERLGAERATILGGHAAVGPAAEGDLAERVSDVGRFAGTDRYATAAAVTEAALERFDSHPRPLLVTTGGDYPDALAGGALAARLDALVLLTPRLRLTDGMDALVRRHAERFSEVVILGGTGAVGPHVEAELQAALAGTPRPGFEARSGPLPPQVRARMEGVSWRSGCPVGLDALAYVEVSHWGFDGALHAGELVVATGGADDVVSVFADLFDAGVPVERMRLVDDYGADDDASMAANNTSGFNCRTVAGTNRWSEHASGLAIDINPVQNPYVRGGFVAPPAGRAYLDRTDVRPGMAVRPGPIVRAFEAIGWRWGGDFGSLKDYQHFSASGR